VDLSGESVLKELDFLSSAEEIIAEVKAGRMVILVDDEDRENEGDLFIPASIADAGAINFMARYGRGLICLTLTDERVQELDLPLMSTNNKTRHGTAFTVSIEATEGVTTGISAADRAATVAAAIDPAKGKDDIHSPGHVFPLVARKGGVLVRSGHTEAAVDIARLAGYYPAGVICEIMNDDGTMARMPDLMSFAQFHGLKVSTIADLIAYRRQNDSLIKRTIETDFHSRYGGEFKLSVYVNQVEYAEHIALVKGDISGDEPVLVRVHAFSILDDVLAEHSDRSDQLHSAMSEIGKAGRGVVVLIREPKKTSLSDKVRQRIGQPVSEDYKLRDYGIGAQILIDLGVNDMILLSNSKRNLIGLDGYGLKIVDQKPIPPL
jgi:3,4-dihydroxy 2-butanone 4-phosphate synthase/GTP cyclohydrolase II